MLGFGSLVDCPTVVDGAQAGGPAVGTLWPAGNCSPVEVALGTEVTDGTDLDTGGFLKESGLLPGAKAAAWGSGPEVDASSRGEPVNRHPRFSSTWNGVWGAGVRKKGQNRGGWGLEWGAGAARGSRSEWSGCRESPPSLTLSGQLQPRAALPDATGGGGRLTPVGFELLDLGLRDRVLCGPVEAAHGATVLVESELQRRVTLLRVQARLAAQGHPAGSGPADLLGAQHPERRRLEQFCKEIKEIEEITEAEDVYWVRIRGRTNGPALPRAFPYPTRTPCPPRDSKEGGSGCVHVEEGGNPSEIRGRRAGSTRDHEYEGRRDQVRRHT